MMPLFNEDAVTGMTTDPSGKNRHPWILLGLAAARPSQPGTYRPGRVVAARLRDQRSPYSLFRSSK